MQNAHQSAWKGLQDGRIPVYLDYATVERMLGALIGQATAWGPQRVVAVAQGGIVPGSMVASAMGLPLGLLDIDRNSGQIAWIGPAPEAGRLLVIDDGCSTGSTVQAVRQWLLAQGRQVLTLCVVHDPEFAQVLPDLSHPMTELWRFPWERGEATPAARARRVAGQRPQRQDELPFHAIDLDGIFLQDIAQSHYDEDLHAALAARDALLPLPVLPAFDPARAVIVTGRPEMDRGRTQAWLDRHGFAHLPLEMRPEGVMADLPSVTRYKAHTATRRGCTHFIESDAQQSIMISDAGPHLTVTWWNCHLQVAHIVGGKRVLGAL